MSDFVPVSSPLVFQPSLSPEPLVECVNISICSDGVVEDNETFSVLLSTDDLGVMLNSSFSTSSVTIIDSDSKLMSLYHNGHVLSHVLILDTLSLLLALFQKSTSPCSCGAENTATILYT